MFKYVLDKYITYTRGGKASLW